MFRRQNFVILNLSVLRHAEAPTPSTSMLCTSASTVSSVRHSSAGALASKRLGLKTLLGPHSRDGSATATATTQYPYQHSTNSAASVCGGGGGNIVLSKRAASSASPAVERAPAQTPTPKDGRALASRQEDHRQWQGRRGHHQQPYYQHRLDPAYAHWFKHTYCCVPFGTRKGDAASAPVPAPTPSPAAAADGSATAASPNRSSSCSSSSSSSSSPPSVLAPPPSPSRPAPSHYYGDVLLCAAERHLADMGLGGSTGCVLRRDSLEASMMLQRGRLDIEHTSSRLFNIK